MKAWETLVEIRVEPPSHEMLMREVLIETKLDEILEHSDLKVLLEFAPISTHQKIKERWNEILLRKSCIVPKYQSH